MAVVPTAAYVLQESATLFRITLSTTILRESLNDLRGKMATLRALRNDVNVRVRVSKDRGLQLTYRVQSWLSEGDEMENRAEELIRYGDQLLEKNCLGRNCWSSYQLVKKIARTQDEVDCLVDKGKSIEEVAHPFPELRVLEMPSDDTVGLDLPFQKVWESVTNDEQCGVIGLCGMGGVGKTTLLKKIYNALRRDTDHFNFVILVTVSQNLNVERIQDEILKNLQITDQFMNENEKALTIYTVLKKRRFFLLLDDVWERIDLLGLGVPLLAHDQNKSKVVFTTRNLGVCRSMEADKVIRLEVLSEEESWFLFKTKVGEDTLNSHTKIDDIAHQVVRECSGLPLAIVTIGRALAHKETTQAWYHALDMLRRPTSEFGDFYQLFSVIKHSYYSLRNDITRKCFEHCSLFSADSPIEKNQLIDYWIGEGFLGGIGDRRASRNMGYAVLGELVSACLLEEDGANFVKMHPLIHDTASWIASDHGKKDKFFARTDVQLAKLPMFVNWKEIEKVSLMNNCIEVLEDAIPPCPKLSTMILSKNVLRFIRNDFFCPMTVLRVLDLSWSKMETLPESIAELIALHYLNLSHTNIYRLPKSIQRLENLEVFDLSYIAELVEFPPGVTEKLSRLQILNIFYCGHASWTEEGDDLFIGTKSFLEELERLSLLNDLSLSIVGEPGLNKLQSSPKLQGCTRSLSIVQCKGLISLPLASIQFMTYLDTLEVHKCHDLKEFKIDQLIGSQPIFHNLQDVKIEDCWSLEELTWLSFAPNLQSLEIDMCMNLKEIISDHVSGASEIEENPGTFSRLKRLYLGYLPELTLISKIALRLNVLEEITIVFCPELRRIPVDSNSGRKTLKMIKGQRKWWDKLEWEDEYLKLVFLPYFTDIELLGGQKQRYRDDKLVDTF